MTYAFDVQHEIAISFIDITLKGILQIPKDAIGLVIFAHGSGSGRLSPRNQYIAKLLQEKKIATVLFDLLTPDEESIDEVTAEYRFNIDFLAQRLQRVSEWIHDKEDLTQLSIGYFGASTGGGAALLAAARDNNKLVKAIVSRGGRPDLAAPMLGDVTAPTLLIVGGDDPIVIELNKKAFAQLNCEKKLEIIPGATHLFEEPGKLEEVARLTITWFLEHLR